MLLGVAYKRDVSDTRESPALTVLSLLKQRGARVVYHDPHVPSVQTNGVALASVRLTGRLLAAQDCVVLLTDHGAFDIPGIAVKARILVDTRNATRRISRFANKIVKLGAPSALLQAFRIKGEAA